MELPRGPGPTLLTTAGTTQTIYTAPTGPATTTTSGLTLPQATIAVASTSGFNPTSGILYIPGVAGALTYTGTTSTSFTGCYGGSGTYSNGAAVVGAYSIIREINIVNETTLTVLVTFGIGTSNADAAGKRLVRTIQLQPGDIPFSASPFFPLDCGATPDLFYAMCDTANGATVTLGVVEGP